jgi:hypothetical protein
MEEALKARNGDPLKAELDTAMQRIGELTMENELLWVRVRQPGRAPPVLAPPPPQDGSQDQPDK